MAPITPAGSQQADLGLLLAGAVQAVVEAQDVLDADAVERARAFAASPAGALTVPPLWFAFESATIDVQLSSEVVRVAGARPGDPPETRLLCRMVNPVSVGLFGYAAASGTRVRVELAPRALVVPPEPGEEEPPSPIPPAG